MERCTFLITFPVWGIFTCEPYEQHITALWHILVNGKQSPVFFTDQDQAERFVKREIEQRPVSLIAFHEATDLIDCIHMLGTNSEDLVSFDPGSQSVHQAKLANLEKVLIANQEI